MGISDAVLIEMGADLSAIMLSENDNLCPSEIKNIINTNSHKIDSLATLCKSGGIIDATACYIAAK